VPPALAQIRFENDDNDDALERTKNGTLDGTHRVLAFLGCFEGAFDDGGHPGGHALDSPVPGATAGESFNDRHRRVVNRWLNGID
jgi:hypothetical protein